MTTSRSAAPVAAGHRPAGDPLTSADYFASLADAVCDLGDPSLRSAGVERVALSLAAEDSDFVSFNHARVRQALRVRQGRATVSVVADARRAEATVTLSGDAATDLARLREEAAALAGSLSSVPPDRHLLLCPPDRRSHREMRGTWPSVEAVVQAVAELAGHLDFVGFHAAGPVVRGYADSTGSRHWHRSDAFHLDWCLYAAGAGRDKAVKCRLAGSHWSPAELARIVAEAEARLPLLARPPLTLAPGRYRAAFSAAAMAELLGTLSWSGFSVQDRRNGTSSLARLAGAGADDPWQSALDPRVTLTESTLDGTSPGFTSLGFVKPDRVVLVDGGRAGDVLASPRSAAEFGVPANAGDDETPQSLRLAPGSLPSDRLLEALGTGLYVSDLWYLNYSDRPSCRMTGMTRFACFWVEGGEPVAPLGVMRFDDSLLRLLGPQGLVDLTDRVELIPDAGTYGGRQLASIRTPAALVEGFTLTL